MSKGVNIWVTSDWHLGHKNILKFDNREFNSIEEHDWYIINKFNSLVKPEDIVYYLGDFAMCRNGLIEHYLASMNGKLNFIKGNHDKKDTIRLYKKYGEFLGHQNYFKIDDLKVIINHFALRVWENSHHGSIHLYGHSHDNLDKHGNYWGRSMDVGVMSALRIKGDYLPFNLEEDLLPILLKRETKIIDHHGL